MRFLLPFQVLCGATVRIVAYIKQRMVARLGIRFFTWMKRQELLKCLSILRIQASSMHLPGSLEESLMRFLQVEKGVLFIKVLMVVRLGRSYLMDYQQRTLDALH